MNDFQTIRKYQVMKQAVNLVLVEGIGNNKIREVITGTAL